MCSLLTLSDNIESPPPRASPPKKIEIKKMNYSINNNNNNYNGNNKINCNVINDNDTDTNSNNSSFN